MAIRSDGAGPILVSACGRTHRGRIRNENQDRLLVANLAAGSLEAHTDDDSARGSSVGPLEFELSEHGAILLVADGMGGRVGGARASALAVAAVRRALTDDASAASTSEPETIAGRLRAALLEANRDIREEAERDGGLRGMGTTATLAAIREGVVWIAQVGDSRGYLVRSGAVTQLTRDQSLVQDMIDSGVLREEDARAIPRNVVLQALGVGGSVQPEVTSHELRRDDVLLLCSDGLSGVVADDEILEAVLQSRDCLTTCDRLVGLANDRGGPDNITVLVARVAGDGLAPAPADGTVGRQVWAAGER
jgi:PPM family protein phosphatase